MSARDDTATDARRIRQLVDEIDSARRICAATSRAIEPTLRDAFDDDARRDAEPGSAPRREISGRNGGSWDDGRSARSTSMVRRKPQRPQSQDHEDERNARVTEIMRRARRHLDASNRAKGRKVRDRGTARVYKAR